MKYKAFGICCVLFLLALLPGSVSAAGLGLYYPIEAHTVDTSDVGFIWYQDDDPAIEFYVMLITKNGEPLFPIIVDNDQYACDGDTFCGHTVTGLETGNYTWAIETQNSLYQTISYSGTETFQVDLGDVEMPGGVTTPIVPDFSNLHCPDETPEGWLTVTPNALWQTMCNDCFLENPFDPSEPTLTATPYGMPTATPTSIVTPTATQAVPTQEPELWVQSVGNCHLTGVRDDYERAACRLDVSAYAPFNDVVAVLYDNVYIQGSPDDWRQVYIGKLIHDCGPYCASDAHQSTHLLPDWVKHWTPGIGMFEGDYYGHLNAKDFVENYFGKQANYRTLPNAEFSTMQSLALQVQQYVTGEFPGTFELVFDGYLLRYGVPQGSVTPTPQPEPTPGPSYCSVIDTSAAVDQIFGHSGIVLYGAPVCIDIGPYSVEIGFLDFALEIPHILDVCLQGVFFGNLTLFGIGFSLDAILTLAMLSIVITRFTRK